MGIKTPWVILICQLQGDPPGSPTNPTIDRALLARTFSANDGSFNLVRYFREMSHGRLDLTGSQVFPATGAFMIDPMAITDSKGTQDLNKIMKAAQDAATAAGVPLAQFFGVGVVLGVGGTHGWPRFLFADPRYFVTSGNALEHEVGHGFGLEHSRVDDSQLDYQDPWDIMSAAGWPTWMPDPNYGNIGPGLNAWNMRGRGWLDETRVWAAPNGYFDQIVQLRPLHRPDLPGFLAAELPPIEPFAYDAATRSLFPGLPLNDGAHGRYLVEFRLKERWDGGIARSAVMVHRFSNNHSYLMRRSPKDNNTDFVAGDTFTPFGVDSGLAMMKVIGIDETNQLATIQLRWSAPRVNTALAVAGVGTEVYFFAKSLDGRGLYNRAQLGQAGHGWVEIEGDGRISSAPAAGAVGTHVFVAARGLDGSLYLNQADQGKPFGQWFPMNFATDVAPAVVGVGDSVYFFAKRLDGRVFYCSSRLGQASPGWVEVDGDGRISSAPAAGAVGTHVFVAARGLDGSLYLNQADQGKPFGQWFPMNFATDVAPAVVGVGNNIYVFAKHLDGRIFYNRSQLGQASHGWVEVEGGGRTDTAPAAGAVGQHVFVAIRGLDGTPLVNQADLGQPFGAWFRA